MTCLHNDPLARSQFHAQAIATMGIDPAWDRAVTNYIACEIRGKADDHYGPDELASHDRQREADDLSQRLGPKWREHPEGVAISEAMTAESRRAEDDRSANFYTPMWESHRQLVAAPAPSLAAVALKAAIIELHEVWIDAVFEGDCIAILDADLARLSAARMDIHTREPWDLLRAAYDAANSAADRASLACEAALPDQVRAAVEASDDANSAEYKAWQEVMKAAAPDLAAVQWKLVELFGENGRERIEGIQADDWLFQFTDVILADVERLNGGAA